ncbi:MAG: class SAM-dependent methyltransferase [Bacilli bacterium]|nr:class SAM-dependent methyltransferase [Bacilli bacterium]
MPQQSHEQGLFFEADVAGVDLVKLNQQLIKRAEGRGIDDEVLELFSLGTIKGRHAAKLSDPLAILTHQSTLSLSFPIRSHRRTIGPVLVVGKKVVRNLLRWLLSPILTQQSKWNHAAYEVHVHSLLVLEELERRVQELESQLESERRP